MREIDELRQLTALQLLNVWRDCAQEAEDPLERSLLANAEVLVQSCFYRNEPVFAHRQEVLATMTGREMEALLERLSCGRQPAAVNPAFDQKRFEALREG